MTEYNRTIWTVTQLLGWR